MKAHRVLGFDEVEEELRAAVMIPRRRQLRVGSPALLRLERRSYAFSKDFREERGHAYMLDDVSRPSARAA